MTFVRLLMSSAVRCTIGTYLGRHETRTSRDGCFTARFAFSRAESTAAMTSFAAFTSSSSAGSISAALHVGHGSRCTLSSGHSAQSPHALHARRFW